MGIDALFLLASCATAPKVASDYDRSADFASCHMFPLMQPEHDGIPNLLMATRVEEEIVQELQRRGLTLPADPASANFTVHFMSGAQERLRINSDSAAYAGPWFGGGRFWGSNIDMRQYCVAALAIDIFDKRAHRPASHGWAQKEVTRKDLEQPETISKTVNSVPAKSRPARKQSSTWQDERGSQWAS